MDASENIIEAIKLVPKKEWTDFFQSLRNDIQTKLAHTPDEELTTLKQRVILINELEFMFTSQLSAPSTK